jgi:hypothetical protein
MVLFVLYSWDQSDAGGTLRFPRESLSTFLLPAHSFSAPSLLGAQARQELQVTAASRHHFHCTIEHTHALHVTSGCSQKYLVSEQATFPSASRPTLPRSAGPSQFLLIPLLHPSAKQNLLCCQALVILATQEAEIRRIVV